ncbi:MAG: shikimate kinase [Flavobacteriales bacterium]|nr:shikimate kinase [Flavobacteriales bacterium]
MKIFLIGFMGSGKTSVGKKLAKYLDIEFVDLDHFIEAQAGMSINAIFDGQGEQTFRNLEKDALKKLSGKENAVIATGGGTPCFEDNMNFLNEHGLTIYLKLEPGALFERLVNAKTDRPLLKNLNDQELKDYLEKKLAERSRIYDLAQHTVEAAHITNAVKSIHRLLKR